MKKYKLIFFVLLTSCFVSLGLSANEVRAAIDFGSGAMKIQVNVVDVEKDLILGKPLFATHSAVNLTEDVAVHDGNISQAMEQKALNVLRDYKNEALRAAKAEGYSVVQFSGIATAVFRKAKNGADILEKFEQEFGIRFQILSQDKEGELGFLTGHALFPDVLNESLLAWDSGSGSCHIFIGR